MTTGIIQFNSNIIYILFKNLQIKEFFTKLENFNKNWETNGMIKTSPSFPGNSLELTSVKAVILFQCYLGIGIKVAETKPNHCAPEPAKPELRAWLHFLHTDFQCNNFAGSQLMFPGLNCNQDLSLFVIDVKCRNDCLCIINIVT